MELDCNDRVKGCSEKPGTGCVGQVRRAAVRTCNGSPGPDYLAYQYLIHIH